MKSMLVVSYLFNAEFISAISIMLNLQYTPNVQWITMEQSHGQALGRYVSAEMPVHTTSMKHSSQTTPWVMLQIIVATPRPHQAVHGVLWLITQTKSRGRAAVQEAVWVSLFGTEINNLLWSLLFRDKACIVFILRWVLNKRVSGSMIY